MIDEDATFKRFGYRSSDLTPKAKKYIVVICPDCGRSRDVRKDAYHVGMRCAGCAAHAYGGELASNWQGGGVDVVCAQCGKTYHIKKCKVGISKFCSNECNGKWNSEHRVGDKHPCWNGGKIFVVCEQCGREYEIKPSKKGRSRFCSKRCYGDWMKIYCSGDKASGWRGGPVSMHCIYCGKKFDYQRSNTTRKFCSRVCADAYTTGKNHPMWNGGEPVVTCEQCGKLFKVRKHRKTSARFCSFACFGRWESENRSGEHAGNWQGGISFAPYCKLWNEYTRERIRNKYKRKCFLCGKNEKDNGRKLAVHHVNYGKMCMCDYDCALVPLCASCHSRTNYNRHYWFSLIMCNLNLEFSAEYMDFMVVV